MPVINQTCRNAATYNYHKVVSGDTASDLQDWVASLQVPPFVVPEDPFVEDGAGDTFDVHTNPGTGFDVVLNAAIGDFIVTLAFPAASGDILNPNVYTESGFRFAFMA